LIDFKRRANIFVIYFITLRHHILCRALSGAGSGRVGSNPPRINLKICGAGRVAGRVLSNPQPAPQSAGRVE